MRTLRQVLLWLAVLAAGAACAVGFFAVVVGFMVWPVQTLAAVGAVTAAVIARLAFMCYLPGRAEPAPVSAPAPARVKVAGPQPAEDPLRTVLGAEVFDELNAIG